MTAHLKTPTPLAQEAIRYLAILDSAWMIGVAGGIRSLGGYAFGGFVPVRAKEGDGAGVFCVFPRMNPPTPLPQRHRATFMASIAEHTQTYLYTTPS